MTSFGVEHGIMAQKNGDKINENKANDTHILIHFA